MHNPSGSRIELALGKTSGTSLQNILAKHLAKNAGDYAHQTGNNQLYIAERLGANNGAVHTSVSGIRKRRGRNSQVANKEKRMVPAKAAIRYV